MSEFVPTRSVKDYDNKTFVVVCEHFKNAPFTQKFLGLPPKPFRQKAINLDCYFPKYFVVNGCKVPNKDFNPDVPKLQIIQNPAGIGNNFYMTDEKVTDGIISNLLQQHYAGTGEIMGIPTTEESEPRRLQDLVTKAPDTRYPMQTKDEALEDIADALTRKVVNNISEKLTNQITDQMTDIFNQVLNARFRLFEHSILSHIDEILGYQAGKESDDFKAFKEFKDGQSDDFQSFVQFMLSKNGEESEKKVIDPKSVEEEEDEYKGVQKEIEKPVCVLVREKTDEIAKRIGYPTTEEWCSLIKNYDSYEQIAKAKKVYVSTVRNWAKFHGIYSRYAREVR